MSYGTAIAILKDLASLAAPIITASSAVIALGAYQRAKKWDKARAARDLIEDFFRNEDNRLAIRMIDWKTREIPIPQRYAPQGKSDYILQHSREKLFSAFDMNNRELDTLESSMELKYPLRNSYHAIYVDIFDAWFSSIGRIYQFVEKGALSHQEIEQISYWLRKIRASKHNGASVFMPYLEYYGYTDVIAMIDAAERNGQAQRERSESTWRRILKSSRLSRRTYRE